MKRVILLYIYTHVYTYIYNLTKFEIFKTFLIFIIFTCFYVGKTENFDYLRHLLGFFKKNASKIMLENFFKTFKIFYFYLHLCIALLCLGISLIKARFNVYYWMRNRVVIEKYITFKTNVISTLIEL